MMIFSLTLNFLENVLATAMKTQWHHMAMTGQSIQDTYAPDIFWSRYWLFPRLCHPAQAQFLSAP